MGSIATSCRDSSLTVATTNILLLKSFSILLLTSSLATRPRRSYSLLGLIGPISRLSFRLLELPDQPSKDPGADRMTSFAHLFCQMPSMCWAMRRSLAHFLDFRPEFLGNRKHFLAFLTGCLFAPCVRPQKLLPWVFTSGEDTLLDDTALIDRVPFCAPCALPRAKGGHNLYILHSSVKKDELSSIEQVSRLQTEDARNSVRKDTPPQIFSGAEQIQVVNSILHGTARDHDAKGAFMICRNHVPIDRMRLAKQTKRQRIGIFGVQSKLILKCFFFSRTVERDVAEQPNYLLQQRRAALVRPAGASLKNCHTVLDAQVFSTIEELRAQFLVDVSDFFFPARIRTIVLVHIPYRAATPTFDVITAYAAQRPDQE